MNAADIYVSALNGWKLKDQERSPVKQDQKRKPKPKRLTGGCLLYRLASKGAGKVGK